MLCTWQFIIIIIVFLFSLNVFPVYSAYKKHFEITARKIEVFHKPEVVIAKGDVVISGKDFFIWAQEVKYEIETEYFILEKFKIFDLKENIITEGNEGFLDLRNGEVWADRVFIFLKKEQIRIKAKDFRKNALNEYLAKKALITTCEIDCESERDFPPWSLEIDNFILTSEGLSSGDATKFRIKKIPVGYVPKAAYLPKASLPIGVPRKTGLLTPKFSQGSRLGFGLQIPFFWALTDQIDFTISPFYFTKRGLLIDIENQFKFREDFQGLIKFRYIKDEEKTGYEVTEEPEKNKWWVISKIDYAVKPNLDMHLDLDVVSEKGFLEEFDVGEGGYTTTKAQILRRFDRDIEDKAQEYRTSKFWVQYYRNSLYARLESTYLDYHGNLDEDTILQPYFNLNFNFLPTSIFNVILPEVDLRYFFAYREEGYYGDKINANIGITYPFKIGMFFNSATARYNFSFYNLREKDNFKDSSIDRNYFEFLLNSYTILSKYYGILTIFNKNLKILHTLKPYITYFYRSKPSEVDVPQFDYEDLINDKLHTLEYGLWQYFSLPYHRNFLIIRAYQQYDFTKAQRSATATKPEEKPFSDLYMQVILNYSPYVFARYDTTYNFYGFGFKKHSLNLSLRELFLDYISLIYQEDSAWNTKQLTMDLKSTILNKILGEFYISRNLIRDETTEMRLIATYLHQCYTLSLGFSLTPKDTKFYFLFELKGLGGYGIER
ncbi:MAG: LPS assembly outer membrane protein LptD [Thermodesulfobacterium sp.]|uniref:LPS assembly outer membrane protein LptD n=1 Tax=Candidatus Thermodesulfobacterium syntrophicum TaxID=3060442 RepID=A0AAE3P3B0_9BACT|nr:LPS assembly outer membrane protein LptD [Candidatus Thermodesulfobacterium syntrophicum]